MSLPVFFNLGALSSELMILLWLQWKTSPTEVRRNSGVYNHLGSIWNIILYFSFFYLAYVSWPTLFKTTVLQVRLELTTSELLRRILPYKYCILANYATGALCFEALWQHSNIRDIVKYNIIAKGDLILPTIECTPALGWQDDRRIKHCIKTELHKTPTINSLSP